MAGGTQFPLPPPLSGPERSPHPLAAGPPVWGAERTAEGDQDGTTDWQPVGERRRRCQGTAWRAKTPREPENNFGEKWGRDGVYSAVGGAEEKGPQAGAGEGQSAWLPGAGPALGGVGGSRSEAAIAAR